VGEFERRLEEARAKERDRQAALDVAAEAERQARAVQVQRAMALVSEVQKAVAELQRARCTHSDGRVRYLNGQVYTRSRLRRLFTSGRRGWTISYVFVPHAGPASVTIDRETLSIEEFARRGSVSYYSPGYGSQSGGTSTIGADRELDLVLGAIAEYLK
jgi:hypothetical protein